MYIIPIERVCKGDIVTAVNQIELGTGVEITELWESNNVHYIGNDLKSFRTRWPAGTPVSVAVLGYHFPD